MQGADARIGGPEVPRPLLPAPDQAVDAADPEPCAFAQYPVAGYRKVRVVVR